MVDEDQPRPCMPGESAKIHVTGISNETALCVPGDAISRKTSLSDAFSRKASMSGSAPPGMFSLRPEGDDVGELLTPTGREDRERRRHCTFTLSPMLRLPGSLLTASSPNDVQCVRKVREAELITEVLTDHAPPSPRNASPRSDDAEEEASEIAPSSPGVWHVAAPWVLKACGILPWQGGCGRVYRYAVVLIAAATAVAFAGTLVLEYLSGRALRFDMMVDLVIAVGALLGLIAARGLYQTNLLGDPAFILVRYADQQAVIDPWASMLGWQNLVSFSVWVATGVFRLLSGQDCDMLNTCTLLNWISLGTRMLSTGLFIFVVGGILHVCSGLTLFIDAFCYLLATRRDIETSVNCWNMLQAVLRKASGVIEVCFMVLQTTTLTVALLAMDGYLRRTMGWEWMLIVLLLIFCDARLFLKAGQITDKCSRVPSLINSLHFDDNAGLDGARQYLVEYVAYSDAGFYVGETRLTTCMALKLAYISVICAFGLFTKVVSV